MGKVNSFFTQYQALIFNEIAQDDSLKSNFYFTGGTALSIVYLHHRYSDDLDFFSEKEFDSSVIYDKLAGLSKKHSFSFETREIENIRVYQLKFPNKEDLKIDFVFHPYKRLEDGPLLNRFPVDSIADIATNKLLTVNQRTAVKDFVDLYFLLKLFTVWDLIEGIRLKYHMKINPYILAIDLLKVEEFEFMPKMIKPLTLDQLKSFFKEKAKELGKMSVE